MRLSVSTHFQAGMILQRRGEWLLSGTAHPGVEVVVRFRGQEPRVRSDLSGRWQARLSTGEAGGPFVMEIESVSESISLDDILVGEVWLASGQSNMEFRLSECSTAGIDVPVADFSRIRYFKTERFTASEERREAIGRWTAVSRQSAGQMSAVAYFFARRVHRELGTIPVGIIQSAWGGSKIEPWIGAEAFIENPDLQYVPGQRQADLEGWEHKVAAFAERMEAWYATEPQLSRDGRLLEDLEAGWHLPDHGNRAWTPTDAPFVKEPILNGDQNGVVWFRKEVEISATMAGRDLLLDLGQIDAQRILYFNGVEVDRTTDAVPWCWMKPAVTRVPASLVQAGRATIAVRCLFQFLAGNPYFSESRVLETEDGADRIDMDRGWEALLSQQLGGGRPAKTREPRPWNDFTVPWDLGRPSSMFNSMIAPLTGFPLRGVLWYQGESNADQPERYRHLLAGMIANWRQRWRNPDLAFGIVQLAGYGEQAKGPMDSHWARFRQMQIEVADAVPGCGFATAIDIGDPLDIHPKDKKPVGERLADWALGAVYGHDLEWSGPRPVGADLSGGTLSIRFSRVAERLHTRHDPIRGFDIRDGAGIWHRVVGRVEGVDTVVVDVSEILGPDMVRYAWGNTPDCDLENSRGLPAFPFQIQLS